MQHFSSDLLKTRQRLNPQLISTYDKMLQASSKKMMLMESIQLADMARSEESIKYALRGGIIALALLALNGTIYPLSVRLVKKVFGFKDFFYVHFTILPIIVNVNALLAGAIQGFTNARLMMSKYPLAGSSNIIPQMKQTQL